MSKIQITEEAKNGALIISSTVGEIGFIMLASGSYEEFDLDENLMWEVKTSTDQESPLWVIEKGCLDTIDLTHLLV